MSLPALNGFSPRRIMNINTIFINRRNDLSNLTSKKRFISLASIRITIRNRQRNTKSKNNNRNRRVKVNPFLRRSHPLLCTGTILFISTSRTRTTGLCQIFGRHVNTGRSFRFPNNRFTRRLSTFNNANQSNRRFRNWVRLIRPLRRLTVILLNRSFHENRRHHLMTQLGHHRRHRRHRRNFTEARVPLRRTVRKSKLLRINRGIIRRPLLDINWLGKRSTMRTLGRLPNKNRDSNNLLLTLLLAAARGTRLRVRGLIGRRATTNLNRIFFVIKGISLNSNLVRHCRTLTLPRVRKRKIF